MKYSKHNAIIPYKEKYALYNSFHQRVMFLDPSLKDILQAAIIEGIDNLNSIHPTFYQYLKEQEYLLETDIDEIEMVKELRHTVDYNNDLFFLTINPSMNCNFKCWYCYETHVKGSSLNETMIDSINKFCTVTFQKDTLKHFTLSFFGGEPLLYFKRDVQPIITHFIKEAATTKVTYDIGFTTNGYLINQDFIDYFKNNRITCALQITLDGYKENHDLVRFVSAKKGSYNQIINNIKLLINNGFFVRLRVNYTEKNISDTYKIAEEFNDIETEIRAKNLMFDFHRVWQNDKVDDTDIFLDENVDIIRKSGIKVSSKNSPNNVRDSCYADKLNSAVINYNGDIFKCTARDFTTAKRAGYLSQDGELIWEEDYLNKRMAAKFHNKPCLSCKIMPICNGGCSQHALEGLGGDDYCVYHGDENEKDKVVRTKIDELLDEVPA